MADGRYLIFYTFAPSDRRSSHRADPISEAKTAKPAEDH